MTTTTLERQLARAQAKIRQLERLFEDKTREIYLAHQEQRRLEVQLRHAQKLESLGQLAAGVAHEINTPAQYVMDNTRFVKESMADLGRVIEDYRARLGSLPDPADQEALRELEASLDLDFLLGDIPVALDQSLEGMHQIARIVHAMKDFAHPGSSEHAPVDLHRAVQLTVDLTRSEWRHVAEVHQALQPVPSVRGLAGDIKQVLMNLVVNAAHAIADARPRRSIGALGRITVRIAQHGDEVALSVSDDGCGIPAEVRNRIFDPFFTTKEPGRGTGQGLTLVHAVMERHQGRVTFETAIGRGTTFTLWFPVDPVLPGTEEEP